MLRLRLGAVARDMALKESARADALEPPMKAGLEATAPPRCCWARTVTGAARAVADMESTVDIIVVSSGCVFRRAVGMAWRWA